MILTRKLFLLFLQIVNVKTLDYSYDRRCPQNREWNIRAEKVCRTTANYFCLLNPLNMTHVEGCSGPSWDRPGSKLVLQGNFNRKQCNANRYQPIKFVTEGNSECLFLKSSCSEEGQVLSSKMSSVIDNSCSCNFENGYAFVSQPTDICSCEPSKEDCSCFLNKCSPHDHGCNYGITRESNCANVITKGTTVLNVHSNGTFFTDNSRPLITSGSKTETSIMLLVGITMCLVAIVFVVHFDTLHNTCILTACCRKKVNKPTTISIQHNTNAKLEENDTNDAENNCTNAQVSMDKNVDEMSDDAIQETLNTIMKDEGRKRNVKVLQKEIEILQKVSKDNEEDVNSHVIEKLDKWKDESIKFAVTGETGVGKSSFINTFCNFKPDNPQVAKTSIYGNTTKTVTEYTHPINPKIKLVDLPGFGTRAFSREHYEERMELKSFDYALIFIRTLKEDDIEIASKLRNLGVPFCFVRSKFDDDIKEDPNSTHQSIISRFKSDVDTDCTAARLKDVDMFVISSRNKRIGEFDKLIKHMMDCLSDLKSQNLIFSLAGELSRNVIESKYRMLKNRIPQVAIEVGALASVPVPGVDLVASIGLLAKELLFYYKTFGFDQEHMKSQRVRQIIEKKSRRDSLLLLSNTQEVFYTFALTNLGKWAAVLAVQSAMDVFIPVIGSMVSAGTSIYITRNFLSQILEATTADVEEIYSQMISESDD